VVETAEVPVGPCGAAPYCTAVGRFPRGLCPDCWKESVNDHAFYLDALAEAEEERAAGFSGPRDGEFGRFWAPLSAAGMPPPDATWGEIARFALTFDAYGLMSFAAVGGLANETRDEWFRSGDLPGSLVDLRCCLFFEQRRYHHFGTPPEPDHERYLRALLEAIRGHAVAGTGRGAA
jgi:hypothetical protein